MFGKSQPLSGSPNNSIHRDTLTRDAPISAGDRSSPALSEDYLALMEKLVAYAVSKGGSDIHLRIGSFPIVRILGDLVPVETLGVLSAADLEGIVNTVLRDRERDVLDQYKQVDTSVGFASTGRVRLNVFYQRGTLAVAVRIIKTDIPTLDQLGLPEIINRLARLRSGLVLVTGATGTGKSTTLAALVNEINSRYPRHIITIEDPIEFLFRDKKSLIAQREIGIDTLSFDHAMTAALREDPDVILLSDLRSMETMEFAMNASETGHLVLGTLHAPTAPDAISRIVGSFPASAQNTIRTKLSQNLKAVIGQRLLPSRDRTTRVLAHEIMLVTPRIQELILDPVKVIDIAELMQKNSSIEGLVSFDRHIFELYSQNRISDEVAVRYATSPNDMGLKLRGFAG